MAPSPYSQEIARENNLFGKYQAEIALCLLPMGCLRELHSENKIHKTYALSSPRKIGRQFVHNRAVLSVIWKINTEVNRDIPSKWQDIAF